MLQKIRLVWNIYFDFHYGAAIVIGIILFVFCTVSLSLWKKKHGKNMNGKEMVIIFLLCIYLTFLFGVTLLNRRPEQSYSMELMPFWSYQESLFNGNVSLGEQIFYNIMAFVPFGIFFPVLLHNMQRLRRVAAAALLLSAFIETTQLLFKCGLCELDDVMNNTLGAVIGYGIWRGVNITVRGIRENARRGKRRSTV